MKVKLPLALVASFGLLARAGATQPVITHKNVATILGHSLSVVAAGFPSCQLSPLSTADYDWPPQQGDLPPFYGYSPAWTEVIGTLNWDALEGASLKCAAGDNPDQNSYILITFQHRVMVVAKSFPAGDADSLDPKTLLDSLASAIPGHPGPTHEGQDDAAAQLGMSPVPVCVTYVDDRTLRTIIEVEAASVAAGVGYFPASISVAYVDRPTWRLYEALGDTVAADRSAENAAKEKAAKEKVRKGLAGEM